MLSTLLSRPSIISCKVASCEGQGARRSSLLPAPGDPLPLNTAASRLPVPPLSPLHPVWSPSNSFVSPGGRLLWKPPSAEIALWVSGCAWLPPSDLGLWSRGKGEGRLRLELPPQPLELPCRATKCFLGGQIRIRLRLRPTGPPLMTVIWLRAGRGSPLESETLRGTASWEINACPELGLGGFSMFFWPLFPGPHLAHRSNLGKLNG